MTARTQKHVPIEPRPKVHVSLPQALFDEISAWCHVRGVTMTEFVRQASTEKLGKDRTT